MSWVNMKLGDVITLKRGYDLPSSMRDPGDIPVISSSGITGHHKDAKVKGPGVVTGRYGTLGEVFFVEQDFWPLNTALYVQDFKGNTPRFIAYFLRQVLGRASSDKAAVPGVNRNDLHARTVRFPDLHTQVRIVSILSNYDDLIENNRRRIQLLEQAARLLYKEWFVHLRFPGHEHVKIKDGVPEGWERVTIPDIIDINPNESVSKESDIRYVPMSSLSEAGMTVDISGTEIRQKATPVKFRNGDTLLARITPCLENGKTGFVNFLGDNEVACGSTEFIVLRGRGISPYFVYCIARTHDFRGHAIKSMIGSSGRQRVQVSCFHDFSIGLPPTKFLHQFDVLALNCFKQIGNLMRQNEQLRKARDLFLPRLMNGEIVV